MIEPEINIAASVPPGEAGDPAGAAFPSAPWLETLRLIAQHYRLPVSIHGVGLAAQTDGNTDEREHARNIGRRMGLRIKFVPPRSIELSHWHLPAALKLKDGRLALVRTISSDRQASVTFGGEQGLEQPRALDTLLLETEEVVLARPARTVRDARVDAYIKPYERNWLSRIVFRERGTLAYVMVTSLIVNSLGLTGIMFSMQVYDRVVPAQSFNTLYVLVSGVVLALVFDFFMRRARASIIDVLGKQVDVRMSDLVFGHAMRTRNRDRPSSTGSFIAQLRDIDQVREMLTSTTVAALADIPFFLVFVTMYWSIGGPLVAIPLGALAALVLPGLLLQMRLRSHANEAMREGSLRNAMLVEVVQGLEDIKSLQAEERFQRLWNHYNAVTAEAQLKLRAVTTGLGAWSHVVQTGVYTLTIFVGAPMVIAGDMTTGALVGASILGSRMIAPMGQFSQIAGRLQQARIAKKGLDRLMRLPVDHPDGESRIHCPRIEGNYRLERAMFSYGAANSPVALTVRDLTIQKGERIAVLGRNGAGKSTLLLAMSGLLDASAGDVLLDNLALHHIDPADLRRDVGLLTQNSRLFFGTLRDNLLMGAPAASDADLQAVLEMVAAAGFVSRLPKGLEYVVQEGGLGLSGGQKQALLLARLLIREPSVLLLDEPTASMDETAERHFIERFSEWSAGRTVVIATHRMRALQLVDRVLVAEHGAIVLDNGKEQALRTLRGLGQARPPGTPQM